MATRDPEATRAKLLAAARHEFSAKGIAGARVDAIAEAAGVNKQLVYYYFGSKDGLFREILRERLAQPKGVPADDSPTTGARLAAAARTHLEDPDYVRLLMWEALEAGPEGAVAEEDGRRELYLELVERVRQAQAAGEIPAELDPAQVVLSRVAQVMFPVAFPQLARLVTGTPVTSAAFVDARTTFLRTTYR
ncbi:TetR/AcrR family transcriptional regulator [Aquihabitans sp. G128]|uniref:TetR/AcrR family transcriptional regulator n=1 Tax=Aquihabitans sp. G128 TaxID=2849779 RepID=UPI001C226CD5|nr:TetR/AcrR family transcriptional regulator [Aquihabitans sp. G128]QXC60327.1 TetR/AcrR family transcriptional regulator [Aquihabitans sp. G128]